jgi:hypothetical protein
MSSLVLRQFAGYGVLVALIYTWLAISDRSVLQVLLSAVLAIGIAAGAAWLFGDALAGPSCFETRRLPKLLFWLLLAAIVIVCGLWLADYRTRVGLSIASRLTLWLRRPVKPPIAGAVYAMLLRALIAAAVLAILPFASQAAEGTRRTAAAALRSWRYWAACAVLVTAGFYLPGLLVTWVPKLSGLFAQVASMLVRFAAAYLIAVAAWLAIAASARRFRYAATR